jgi:uncharacterized protein (DUF849 family)
MKKKLIIEARINEYEMRDRNPNVPWTLEEIAADAVACRSAGAAIAHFHARTPDGAPEPRVEITKHIIRRLRESSDILINPTLGSVTQNLPSLERLKPILDLCDEVSTRPDILPLCFGSPNWDFHDRDRSRLDPTEKVYANSTADLIASTRALKAARVGVSCVLWEIGSTRRLIAFLEAGLIKIPAYMLFHLTSGGMLAGHPGTLEGLDAHLAFLPKGHQCEWAVMNLHGSILPLVEKIAQANGHIQIGIGDYHYEELGRPTNAELVHMVVKIATCFGRDIATPQEARAMLGLTQEHNEQS